MIMGFPTFKLLEGDATSAAAPYAISMKTKRTANNFILFVNEHLNMSVEELPAPPLVFTPPPPPPGAREPIFDEVLADTSEPHWSEDPVKTTHRLYLTVNRIDNEPLMGDYYFDVLRHVEWDGAEYVQETREALLKEKEMIENKLAVLDAFVPKEACGEDQCKKE